MPPSITVHRRVFPSLKPTIRIKTAHLLGVLSYLLGIALFWANDADAAVLFAILVPAAAVFLVAAIANKHLCLTLFALFFFVTNGLSPAFFFLQRDIYSYSGWGAVGSFDFSVSAYLRVCAKVFELMTLITGVCLLTTQVALKPGVASVLHAPRRVDQTVRVRAPSARAGGLLVAFILFLGIPLSLFMFSKGIGLVGVENVTRLPFRLSGILYYVRYFLVPILLFYLYAKSSRSGLLVTLVLLYSGVAGVASVSRSLLILSAVSVPAYAYLDRKYTRLLISVAVILSLYAIVTAARAFVYSFESLNLLALLGSSQLPSVDTIAAITSRLGGAQDNVLASQYVFPDPMRGIIRFFLGRPIIENYALELYGFNLPEGMAFGVGFTLFPSLLMLAGREPALMVFVGTLVGLALVFFEKLVRLYLAVPTPSLALTGYPLSFLLVFTLFGANFSPLYFFLTASILELVAYRATQRGRRSLAAGG